MGLWVGWRKFVVHAGLDAEYAVREPNSFAVCEKFLKYLSVSTSWFWWASEGSRILRWLGSFLSDMTLLSYRRAARDNGRIGCSPAQYERVGGEWMVGLSQTDSFERDENRYFFINFYC